MEAILFSIAAFISTMAGGWFCIRHQTKLNLLMGFTAGVLLAVVFFDILPEIMTLTSQNGISQKGSMVAVVLGFMTFHILGKFILNHFKIQDANGQSISQKHPKIGMASALALASHSFMDGMGIGFGFQVSNTVGVLVTIAVIAHDFTDGMNTVAVLLMHKNSSKRAWRFLLLDAVTPILGAASTLLFTVPAGFLVLYLGFFAGFLLYIGASEILPEAHSKESSLKTVGLTILGVVLIYVISRLL